MQVDWLGRNKIRVHPPHPRSDFPAKRRVPHFFFPYRPLSRKRRLHYNRTFYLIKNLFSAGKVAADGKLAGILG